MSRYRRPVLIPSTRFWLVFTASVTLSLVSCGGTVTAIALNGHRVATTAQVKRHAAGSESAQAGQPEAPPSGQQSSGGSGPSGSASARTAVPACSYQPTDPDTATVRVRSPPWPRPTLANEITARIRTNLGEITLRLDGRSAPCTVNAFVSLARGNFYGGTSCHRLTRGVRSLLQCGDPSGTGAGGPGYRFDDEALPSGKHPAYPSGTIAMSNSAPNANGSQFFIVYADTDSEPYYPVFGRVSAGMDIIAKVAAAGIVGDALDGQPALPLRINAIMIG